MILGNLANWHKERVYMHGVMGQILDELRELDFAKLENGKYLLRGEDAYYTIMELDARERQATKAEKHEQFIDLHYVIEGHETIGWAAESDRHLIAEADKDNDYTLYDAVEGEQYVELTPGMFAVFYPHDLHTPGLAGTGAQAPSRIRKVVMKMNKALFTAL